MTDRPEDLTDHLAAGRRAAMQALIESPSIQELSGTAPEIFNGCGDIIVNGMKIGSAIDAAVMETLVRTGCAPMPMYVKPPRNVAQRFWDWFWHSHEYTQTPLLGTLAGVAFGIWIVALVMRGP